MADRNINSSMRFWGDQILRGPHSLPFSNLIVAALTREKVHCFFSKSINTDGIVSPDYIKFLSCCAKVDQETGSWDIPATERHTDSLHFSKI